MRAVNIGAIAIFIGEGRRALSSLSVHGARIKGCAHAMCRGRLGRVLLLAAALCLWPVMAMAVDVYIADPPVAKTDPRRAQAMRLLRAALEVTRSKYGPYTLTVASTPMERARVLLELKTGSRLNVSSQLTNAQWEKELIPVRIPVDKGLDGFRVPLIDGRRQAEFSAVHSLEQLHAYTIGAGAQWMTRSVLEKDGFKVVAGSSYEGLFGMLMERRFDLLPRAIDEALGEQQALHEQYPNLALESTFAIYHPVARYFFVSPAAQRLAERLREGLETLIASGEFDRLFFEHYGPMIEKSGLCQRRIFRIENPDLPPETPLEDAKLWFDPFTVAGGAHGTRRASPCQAAKPARR